MRRFKLVKWRRVPRVGDKVRVINQKRIAYITRLMDDTPGGVVLDRPIDGFRLWNTDRLILVLPWNRVSLLSKRRRFRV